MVAAVDRSEEGLWLVVGGADKGGIVVRTGAEFWSSELPRLQTGSVVRETQRDGDRLQFEKVKGAGPEMGWVSLTVKGKPLLAPAAPGVLLQRPQAGAAAKLSQRDAALAAVRQDWRELEEVPLKFRADRAFVMSAVESCGHALMYAAEELRADKGIVLAAVAQNGNAIKHASKALRADFTVVLAAAQQTITALRHVPAAALADRDTVLALVEQDPQALQHASRELRADREVLLAAVGRDARSLEHAAATFRGDRDVVLAAVRRDAAVLDLATAALRRDRELVLAAIETDGTALRFASAELRADREVVTAAVLHDVRALEHAAPRLRADRELVRQAVERDWTAVKYAAEELRGDFDIMNLAVAQDRQALEFASPSLRVSQKLQDMPSRAPGTNRGEVQLLEDADEREELAHLMEQAKALRKRTFMHKTPEEDELPDGSHVTVVANAAQTVMLAYLLYACDPKGGQCLFVFELAVQEDHRNKGLGRDLLQWAIRRAKAGEVFAVWLNSLKGRPERFYETMGFLPRPEEKPPRDGTVPMALMLRDPSLEAQLQPLKAVSSEGQQRWSAGRAAYEAYSLRPRAPGDGAAPDALPPG